MATEIYVDTKIAEAQLSGGEIDLSGYVTKDELNNKADKTELHSHNNKNILDGITQDKISSWDNKSDFSGKYEDLENPPIIPTVDVNKNYVDTQLNKKVDKKNGYSLISNTEIQRLANVDNYDDSEIRSMLNSKANKTDLHSHSNKTVLDGITSTKIQEWNNKSDFSGKYEDLENPPTIPSLDGYATQTYVKNEIANAQLGSGQEVDLSGYATKDDLNNKADKTELHSHNNKEVLDSITRAKVNSWDNKSEFSGDYNDLSNPPTIPIVDSALSSTSTNAIQNKVVKSALDGKANSSHSHIISDVTNLQTSLDGKSNVGHTHSYNDLSDTPRIPTVTNDLTNVLKSNYDTAYIHSQSAHAPLNAEQNVQSDWNITDTTSDAFIKNKPSIHNHGNKKVLDGITADKVNEWNNKSDFSGDYNDLSNPPTIPIVDSALSTTSINAIQNKVVTNALNNKANSSHNHTIDNIANLQSTLNNKSDKGHRHDYSELGNTPTIDTALSTTSTNAIQNKVVTSALNEKADNSHIHSINDITNLQNSLNSKSDKGHKHDYSELENAPTIPTVDVNKSYVDTQLNKKVDKKNGYSLIADTEIQRLANVDNYDDTEIRSTLNSKANKTDLHSHSNKTVLDGITATKVQEWDNKSNFSGKYEDLENPPIIPTVDSALSTTSTNAIQNKVVTNALNGKANTSHTHNYAGSPSSGGSASSAIKLATSRKISLNGDASGSANFDGTSDITINTSVRKYCMVGSDVENSNGWYKVASETMSGYGDTNITFIVTSTYGNYHSGILQLQIRSDNTNISCKTLVWFNRYGFSTDNFIVNINNMTWTLYTNQTISRYGRLMFEVISESSITTKTTGITLFNSSTKESTTPVATVKSKDGGKVDNALTANKLATSRTLTIGKTGKTFDGSANVSWSLDEIGASASSHTHTISNVTNLQTALDGKSNTGHTHDYSELNNPPTIPVVDSALSSTSTNAIQNKVVKSALDGQSNTNHTHSYKELSDKPTIPVVDSTLSTTSTNPVQNKVVKSALDGKANSSHTHSISNITNLQTTLDGKSNTNHTHKYAGSSSAGGDATNALACSGNATTSTKLQTARTINGTSFDGSANITTSKWGTARNITIGNTTKTIDGSGNISWTLREIGIYDNIVKIVTNIQELESAMSQGGVIYILEGTYQLGQNKSLEYVSNTHLIALGDVTISINTDSSNYIAMRPKLNGTEGGYSAVENFNMSGITFDGKGTTNKAGLFATAHSRNVHIEGCTFRNLNCSWHLVEVNSSDTVVFDRCTFSDYNYRDIAEGDYFTEAVQLDYAGEGGLYPFTCLLDNTGCQNITFNNCTFTRVKTTWTACLGSHSYLKDSMPKNITLNGCRFEDIDNCIYGLDYKNLSVLNSTFYNVATAIIIDSREDNDGTSISAIGNRYNGCNRSKNISQFNGTDEGRFIMHHNYHNRLSSSNISNNFIEKAYSHGIGISPVDTTIIGNSVRYCGKHGIYLYGGQQTTIIGNTSVGCGTLSWYTGRDIYIAIGSLGYVKRCIVTNNAAYVYTDGNSYEATKIQDNL